MKKVLAGLLLAAMAALYGCSGDGGTSGPATAVGKFVDAPVVGLQYESGSQKGVTGADGSFTYEVGKKVKFFIGDIVLGEASAKEVMTPIDLSTTANADSTTLDVVARVQLLMSLSSTDPTTANGVITIPPAALTAAKGKTINFTTPTNLSEVVGQLVTGNNLVTADAAKAHFAASLEKLKTPTTPTTTAGFTSAIVSGKVLQDATTWDNVAAVNTRVFNADGSYKLTTAYVSSPNNLLTTNTGTWSINSSGQLVVTTTTSTGGDPLGTRTFDLVSATSTGLTMGSNGTTGVFTYVTTPATNGFTTAMISGKTFTFSSTNGTGTVTFKTDNTAVVTESNGVIRNPSWSINSSGQLVIKGSTETDTMTLTSATATTWTATSVEVEGNISRQVTITSTLANGTGSFTSAVGSYVVASPDKGTLNVDSNGNVTITESGTVIGNGKLTATSTSTLFSFTATFTEGTNTLQGTLNTATGQFSGTKNGSGSWSAVKS